MADAPPAKKSKPVYKNIGLAQLPGPKRARAELSVAAATASADPTSALATSSASTGSAELPVRRRKAEFLEAYASHATVVLVAETGSGKSTQVIAL